MEKMAATGLPDHHQHSGQSPEGVASSGSVSSNSNSSQTALTGLPLAPPRTPPDQASIQSSMDKNKETLKRKLMLRRSVNELVDRGIYPPLKTPPAFAEKTKQLERAKTGDLLRHKIQQRPDRQLLVQQHILEDTTIDPSLHERQRLLKRSRLLDGLNGKLAHRPGPLELVQGNILQPSHELANAIKDGTIQFLPTCDTEDMDHSSSSFLFDDESTGSDGAPSPSMDESSDVSSPSSTTTPVPSSESLPISFTLTKSISVPLTINKGPQIPFVSANSAIITASSSTSKLNSSQPGTSIGASVLASSNNNSISNGSGKSRSKKPKPKTMSKARIIKFHEYKGPPSVVKNQSSNVTAAAAAAVALGSSCIEDTPYHILLQQQQLFLQWQLEFQQRQHGTATVSAVSENATSPTLNSVIVTSPVVTTAPTTQLQPIVAGGTGLVQAVTLQQPQTPSNSVLAQGGFSPVSIPSSSQTSTPRASPAPAPPPPPPPPLPPVSRPTQSVAPRQSAKALTAIPATALSLPKLTANLEEMKVADLKAELKKRSLPVSGPKPQLIERLKPFTESSSSNSPSPATVVPKTPNSRPPSCASAPLQFSQTTFHIKTEPNGETTASPVTRPIPTAASLLTSSSPSGASSHTSTFSMPSSLPFSMQGIKTVVSVKPMVKEEPMTTTDISPANSPPTLQASTPVPTTPMSPEYEATSPPSLTPKLTLPSHPIVQSLGKSANITSNHFIHHGSPATNSVTHGQTVVSMNSDIAHSASVVPAEMMPMEVDSVSIDLNQGVDDTAFKAASMGHSLDSANFKALVQHPISSTGFKTVSLSPNSLDNNSIKTVSIDTNIMDVNTIKTINLSPNFDASATIKTINISPNTDPTTIKAINLGSGTDGLKTISLSPVKDASSLLKAVKLPLSQLSPTHISPVQLTGPLTHTLSSPTSLLQLQQLQTLQQLQQQLLQQTQVSQHQFHQHTLQHPHQTTAVQLTANDQVVLAQAKQIEELQRQLQESHLKLKLQQLQQQHMQLQQQQQHHHQQQQQQQQLWQVQIPANFTQNSLLTKLSQDQLTITPQNGQVVTSPLQLQQQQSTQVMLQPAVSVVQQQQQSASVFLNAHTNPQTQVVSGVQQAHIRPQQQQTPVMITNQNIVGGGTSISGVDVSIASSVTSDSGLINMTGLSTGQMTSVTTGQTTVSLPYAIHINLTSSGQVKLPPQLQPITTSAAAAATTTKSSVLAPLQLPAQLLLTPTSTSILATQQIKSEPCTPKAMGPPSTTSVPKSQVTSGQSYVFTATPSSTLLIPGHTNGVISRTMSLPAPSVTTEQQKLNVQCSSPNPYFSGPLKEPPRYDEAIKIKQQQIIAPVNTTGGNSKTLASGDGCLNKPLTLGRIDTGVKSQTMDDVLEILIRNGDLPPSAATEALPTGKLAIDLPPTSVNIATTTSAPCLSVTPSVSAALVTAQSQSMPSSPAVPTITSSARSMSNNIHQNHHHYQISSSTTCPRDQILTSVHTNIYCDTLLNDTHSSSPSQHDTSGGSSSLMLNDGTSHSDEGELLDWGEMLPSPDLCNMDWSSESGFGHLDLGDSSLHLDSKTSDGHQGSGFQNSCESRFGSVLVQDPMCTSNGPGSHCQGDSSSHKNSSGFCTLTMHETEPDLAAFNLGGDTSESIDPASQMDMSEWLDVIMPNPSMNLECMNTPTSVSFTADPILTPRTQQEVFDIFNFDDSDFGPSVMSWDKMSEHGISS